MRQEPLGTRERRRPGPTFDGVTIRHLLACERSSRTCIRNRSSRSVPPTPPRSDAGCAPVSSGSLIRSSSEPARCLSLPSIALNHRLRAGSVQTAEIGNFIAAETEKWCKVVKFAYRQRPEGAHDTSTSSAANELSLISSHLVSSSEICTDEEDILLVAVGSPAPPPSLALFSSSMGCFACNVGMRWDDVLASSPSCAAWVRSERPVFEERVPSV